MKSILVQKDPILAGLKDGFIMHYLSHVFLGQHQLRTQLDTALRGVLVVDQLVYVAVLDEGEILLRLLVLEEVDPVDGRQISWYGTGLQEEKEEFWKRRNKNAKRRHAGRIQ